MGNPKLNRDAHITIPNGYYGFLFHGSSFYIDNHKERSTTSSSATNTTSTRDFLCMVSYREDAKQWVQALQWAAGLMLLPPVTLSGSNNMLCNGFSSKRFSSIVEEEEYNDELVLDDQSSNKRNNDNNDADHNLCNSIITTTNTNSTSKSSKISNNTNTNNSGTVLITKIRKFHIPQKQKEIQYELKILKFKSSTKTNNPSSTSSTIVEEWTYHIPISKIINLLYKIQKEYVNDDDIYFYLLNKNLDKFTTKTNNSIIPHWVMKHDIDKIDEIIRYLSSHTKICNSITWKSFLGLTSNTSNNNATNTNASKIINKRSITIPDKHKEEFVKTWLWKDIDDKITLYDWILFYVTSYPLRIRFFIIAWISVLVTLYNYYITSSSLSSTSTRSIMSTYLSYNYTITLPLYIYICSILFIFYVGYCIGELYPNLSLRILKILLKSRQQNKSSLFTTKHDSSKLLSSLSGSKLSKRKLIKRDKKSDSNTKEKKRSSIAAPIISSESI